MEKIWAEINVFERGIDGRNRDMLDIVASLSWDELEQLLRKGYQEAYRLEEAGRGLETTIDEAKAYVDISMDNDGGSPSVDGYNLPGEISKKLVALSEEDDMFFELEIDDEEPEPTPEQKKKKLLEDILYHEGVLKRLKQQLADMEK